MDERIDPNEAKIVTDPSSSKVSELAALRRSQIKALTCGARFLSGEGQSPVDVDETQVFTKKALERANMFRRATELLIRIQEES
jgi:hypothetical protein